MSFNPHHYYYLKILEPWEAAHQSLYKAFMDPGVSEKIEPKSRKPAEEYGGWPVDPGHPGVKTYDYVEHEFDPTYNSHWAILGNKEGNLLALDIDTYKMTDEQRKRVDTAWGGLLKETPVARTQSGGYLVLFLFDGGLEDLPPVMNYVDIKGDVGKGYVMAPGIFPKYDFVNKRAPLKITKADFKKIPVFEGTTPRREIKKPKPDTTAPAVTRRVRHTYDELEEVLEHDEKLDDLWHGNYSAAGYGDDRSRAECALAMKLAYYFGRDKQLIEELLDQSAAPKWHERHDRAYRDSVLQAIDYVDPRTTTQETTPYKPPKLYAAPPSITRAQKQVEEFYRENTRGRHLLEAPCGAGKTYSSLNILPRKGAIAYFGHNHKELKAKIEEFRQLHPDKTVYHMEGATRLCNTLKKDAPPSIWKKLLEYGVSPKALHQIEDFPCDSTCKYTQQWNEYQDADAIFGPLEFAYVEGVTNGRRAIIDELNPERFIDRFEISREHIQKAYELLVFWCEAEDAPEHYQAALRTPDLRIEKAPTSTGMPALRLTTTGEEGPWAWPKDYIGLCISEAFTKNEPIHPYAFQAIYALIEGEFINGAWKPDNHTLAYDADGRVILRVHQRPDMPTADAVYGLDATAEARIWRKFVLGPDAEHHKINEQELWHKGIQVTQATQYKYPSLQTNSNKNHLIKTLKKDTHRIYSILEEHPDYALVTSRTVLKYLKENKPEVLETRETAYYGALRGTNKLRDAPGIIIIGYPHPGNNAITKLATWWEIDESKIFTEDGEITPEAAFLWRHLVLNEVEHAVHRQRPFEKGRSHIVFITSVIPPGIPVTDRQTEDPVNPTRQRVKEYLEEHGPAKTRTVAESVGVSERHARRLAGDIDIVKVVRPRHAKIYLLRHGGGGRYNYYIVRCPGVPWTPADSHEKRGQSKTYPRAKGPPPPTPT